MQRRIRATPPETAAYQEIELQLTALHPAQLEVTQQAKRFNVVCCGRRWGKTVLGMDRLIQPALHGKPVAWFAPNCGSEWSQDA